MRLRLTRRPPGRALLLIGIAVVLGVAGLVGFIVATGGVMLFAIANILLSLMGVSLVRWDGGPLSIGISAVIVAVAAFNLIIDFKIVEDGVANKAPKWMEWYAGFALLVTIVWLYISILRLLAMLRGGD